MTTTAVVLERMGSQGAEGGGLHLQPAPAGGALEAQ